MPHDAALISKPTIGNNALLRDSFLNYFSFNFLNDPVIPRLGLHNLQ